MDELKEIYLSPEQMQKMAAGEINSTSLDSICAKTGKGHVSSRARDITLGVVQDICGECDLKYNRRAGAGEMKIYLAGMNTFA